MTAAAIQPPLLSTKHQKSATIIFLHSKRMRSIQYIIVAICAVVLFGTVLYFGIKDYKFKEKYRTKEEIEMFPVSKEALMKESETSKTEESKPENVHPYQKEVEKSSSKQEVEKGSLETIKFIQKEGAITDSAGSIFLKSALKNMACSTAGSSPLSISCCGQLLFSEDGSDENHACLLMDTYHIGEAEEEQQKYRLRFTMGDDLVIYEDTNGFPKPDSKCYPIENKSGKEICVSINFILLDNNFTDTTGYNSCIFMNFGYGSDASENKNQLLGYTENVKCDVDKEKIIKKGLNIPYTVILRLKLEPATSETIKASGKDNNIGSVNQTQIEDGDKQPVDNDRNQNTGNKPENTDESEPEGKLEIVPLSYFSGPLLSFPSSDDSDDVNIDELNETLQNDLSLQPDLTEPVTGNSFTSIFSTILNFIRNHILSIFVSRS